MSSLLQLLASREGTAPRVVAALGAGAAIDEVHPRTKEGVLHVLFRRCPRPLELYDIVQVLLSRGADVNLLDYRGATPLSLLVLHVNHGLRYHSYPLPEIQRLEDLAAPRAKLQEEMAALDARYQQQVYLTLELLLTSGADVNAVPDVVPALPASTEWVDAYEHKLMQQEGRWHLLSHDTSMEYSTYNIFNPVSSHRCLNDQRLTPLHLAAWRGDARCIRLLLDHGANARAVTDENRTCVKSRGEVNVTLANNCRNSRGNSQWTGPGQGRGGAKTGNVRQRRGRGALHFLYLYCNKPRDLVKATRALLAAGADPAVVHMGDTPAHLLIPHVFVKRTYHQYLSNTYLLEELRCTPKEDQYINELASCLDLLAEASPSTPCTAASGGTGRGTYGGTDRGRGPSGGGLAAEGAAWDGLLLKLFSQFGHMLTNTDKTFQPRGHYLIPYTFQLDPLTDFTAFFVQHGCKVNVSDTEGQTPLHHLVSSLQNLSTDPSLNSTAAICACFRTLLDAGADCNKRDIYQKTPVFAAVLLTLEAINSLDGHGFDLLSTVLDLLTLYGGDLNVRDCLSVTCLQRAVSSIKRPLRCRATRKVGANLKKFIEALLMNGADPNALWTSETSIDTQHPPEGHSTYALDILFDLHFDLQLHEADLDPECVLPDVIRMVAGCMRQASITQVVQRLWVKQCPELEGTDPPPARGDAAGEARAAPAPRCADCLLVVELTQEPFSLRLSCRQTLVHALRGRYRSHVPRLPLPSGIKRYLLDLAVI